MALLLIYLLIALSISFWCSVAESVLLSVSLSFIKTHADSGKRSAKALSKMKENQDRPLTAILSLNTVAHTIGAAGVGAQATALWGDAYFGIVSAVLTILILVLSEILPKSIGTRYWRSLAFPVATSLVVMIYLMYPVVWIMNGLTKLIGTGHHQEKVSREEIAALAEIGEEEGIFAENETRTIQNLIKSRSLKGCDVMTPRTVVAALDESMKLTDFFTKPEVMRHSRFPVYKDEPDNITGYILKYDVIDHLNKGKRTVSIGTIKRPVVIAYERIILPKLLELLLAKKEQIAVLVDEYGGMAGVVTLEDIIESLFGVEIVDERDGQQADMQALAKEEWRKRSENLNIDKEE